MDYELNLTYTITIYPQIGDMLSVLALDDSDNDDVMQIVGSWGRRGWKKIKKMKQNEKWIKFNCFYIQPEIVINFQHFN